MTVLGLDTLLAAEQDGWDALCRGEGGRYYSELMTPDAVMILVNGQVLTGQTIVDSLKDAPPWTSFELVDPRIVPLSPTAAAVVYTARAVRDAEDEPFVAVMSSVYCQIEGRIRLALYQQTALPG